MSEIVTSLHGMEEILKDPPDGIELYVSQQQGRVKRLVELARAARVAVLEITDAEVSKKAGREHRGAVLLLPEGRKLREVIFEEAVAQLTGETALVVLLDGVTDPQNYGAILRSADQFGADLVVLPARRSASDTPAVSASSAGAVAWVPHTVVPNLTRALGVLKDQGFWIYGADSAGTPVHKTNLKGRVALVLGSEGKGLSRLVKETCDHVIAIPTRGKLDSLNVSVSAGILLYEVRRQQEGV